jgi:hypothetical protein
MRLLAIILLTCSLISTKVYAGTDTWNYQVFAVTTYAPYLEMPFVDVVNGSQVYNTDGSNSSPNGIDLSNPLATGTFIGVNNSWGSNAIHIGSTNRSEYTAIRIWGYIYHPGTSGQTSTIYFAGRMDDGFFLNIDGDNVITDWQQQGAGYWNGTGSWTGVGGQWYEVEMWWYEWSGAAVLDLHYSLTCSNYSTTCMLDIPASMHSTTNDVSITTSQVSTIVSAYAATNVGNSVYIQQSGSGASIDIYQDGTNNFIADTDWSGPAILNGDNQTLDIDQLTSDNGIALGMIGDNINVTAAQGTSGTNGGHKAIIDIDAASNVVGLTQYDGGTLSKHFALIDVDGASNNIQVTQRDNGQKVLFMDVDIISGDIDILQKDTGTHYLELNLTGSASHDVDITQQGTGDHAARVTLGGGYATDFDLLQQGSTDQSYELNSTCSNALGCTVNVTQGE